MQPVFNEYKTVTYMCQYFSKTEDQSSQAMKQAAKEVFWKQYAPWNTMDKNAKSYLNNQESSFHEGFPYFARIEFKEKFFGFVIC